MQSVGTRLYLVSYRYRLRGVPAWREGSCTIRCRDIVEAAQMREKRVDFEVVGVVLVEEDKELE